jgi:hypothetical protein
VFAVVSAALEYEVRGEGQGRSHNAPASHSAASSGQLRPAPASSGQLRPAPASSPNPIAKQHGGTAAAAADDDDDDAVATVRASEPCSTFARRAEYQYQLNANLQLVSSEQLSRWREVHVWDPYYGSLKQFVAELVTEIKVFVYPKWLCFSPSAPVRSLPLRPTCQLPCSSPASSAQLPGIFAARVPS